MATEEFLQLWGSRKGHNLSCAWKGWGLDLVSWEREGREDAHCPLP